MTLYDLIDTFIGSASSDWHSMSCWGYGSGPSYKDQFNFWDVYNGDPNVLTHREHSNVASYKPDLSITIAWGIDVGEKDDRVDRDWAKNNPDPSPGISHYLDFFYNGALVFRTSYCVVDGGRCEIPFPNYDMAGNTTVPRQYHDVIKKLNEITGNGDFDSYFGRTGITIVDEDWID